VAANQKTELTWDAVLAWDRAAQQSQDHEEENRKEDLRGGHPFAAALRENKSLIVSHTAPKNSHQKNPHKELYPREAT
jgi:ABC-type branched-subunit amino acid transport system substrate-binding protein